MKKRIVSLLCAGLLVFSEPYPALAAQAAGTEAVLEISEGAPPGAAEDSSSGGESSSESEPGSSAEKAFESGPGDGEKNGSGDGEENASGDGEESGISNGEESSSANGKDGGGSSHVWENETAGKDADEEDRIQYAGRETEDSSYGTQDTETAEDGQRILSEEETKRGLTMLIASRAGVDPAIDANVNAAEVIAKVDAGDRGLLQASENAVLDHQTGSVVDYVPGAAEVSAFVIAKKYDGNGDFDETTDGNGNDSSDVNGIVRTNDSVTYTLAYSTALGDEYRWNTLRNARMYVQYVLPVSPRKAVFDTEAMGSWLRDPAISEEEGRQVLTGWRAIPDNAEGYGIPGAGTVNCIINVLDMENGEVLSPEFYAWMDDGGNGALPEKAVRCTEDYGITADCTVTCGPYAYVEYVRLGMSDKVAGEYTYKSCDYADGSQPAFPGRMKTFEYSVVWGKRNGSIKGCIPFSNAMEISWDLDLLSWTDLSGTAARAGIRGIRAYGEEPFWYRDPFAEAEKWVPEDMEDRGFGNVEVTGHNGISGSEQDLAGSYTLRLSGCDADRILSNGCPYVVSSGLINIWQEQMRVKNENQSGGTYNATISTSHLTVQDGDGRTALLDQDAEALVSNTLDFGSTAYRFFSPCADVVSGGSHSPGEYLASIYTAVDGRIGYGEDFWAGIDYSALPGSSQTFLNQRGANMFLLFDNRYFSLGQTSLDENEVRLLCSRTYPGSSVSEALSPSVRFLYITKADGSLWADEGEMQGLDLHSANAFRYFSDYSDVPSDWEVCGICAEIRNLDNTESGYWYGEMMRLRLSQKDTVTVNTSYMYTGAFESSPDEGVSGESYLSSSVSEGMYSQPHMYTGGMSIQTDGRAYEKATYDEGIMNEFSGDLPNSYSFGNTVLVVGPRYSISKKFAHNGAESENFVPADGQTRAVFLLEPQVTGELVASGLSALIRDPGTAGLSLQAVYIGGDFTPSDAYGGLGGKEDDFTGRRMTGGEELSLSEILEDAPGSVLFEEEDGGFTVRFTGFESARGLPRLYAVYDLAGEEHKSDYVLTNTASISGDWRSPDEDGKTASASLRVTDITAVQIKKTVDRKIIYDPENELLTWEIRAENDSSTDMKFYLYDHLPEAGDACGTETADPVTYELTGMQTANVSDPVFSVKKRGDGETFESYSSGKVADVAETGLRGVIPAGKTASWKICVKTDGGAKGDWIRNRAVMQYDTDGDGSAGDGGNGDPQNSADPDLVVISNVVETTFEPEEPSEPEVYKEVSRESCHIGEIHTWTISGTIPDGIGGKNIRYGFTDEIDGEKKRLSYEGNLVVRIAEADVVTKSRFDIRAGKDVEALPELISGKVIEVLSEGEDYTAEEPEKGVSGGSLAVDITEQGRKKMAEHTGCYLQILFDTSINGNAFSNGSGAGTMIPNDTELHFENKGAVKIKKNPYTPYVYTGEIVVQKTAQKTGEALSGAEFTLYSAEGSITKKPVLRAEQTDGSVMILTPDQESYANGGLPCTAVSGADGKAVFTGLRDGTYYLRETGAPEGYSLSAGEAAVVVKNGHAEIGTVTANDFKTGINAFLAAGGSGFGRFAFLGTAFSAAGIGVLFSLRRKKKRGRASLK